MREVQAWADKSFDEVAGLPLGFPEVSECSERDYKYSVEVTKVEHDREHVHVMISVSDTGLSAFFPVSTGIIFHSDGRVDLPEI